MSNIRRRFVFGEPGIQRREISEIPREAVREAIANALPHRDHTTDTAVEVNVYMDFVERGEPGPLPRGRRSGKPSGRGRRRPQAAQPGHRADALRSGMIEQYGTGIPRIKRYCDVEGVKFSYRQTANTTVIRFDRPGAQISIEENASMPKHIGAAKYEILDEAERIAITLATERGRVTRRELSETAGIGKMKAVQTLKTLASKGALIWMGKSQNDPHQYYRLPSND